jgi:hypothetical protein
MTHDSSSDARASGLADSDGLEKSVRHTPSDVILTLINQRDDLEERVKKLENQNKAIIQLLNRITDSENTSQPEKTDDSDSGSDDGAEPFFKDIKPSDCSVKIRKNALEDFFKEKERNGHPNGYSADIYELSREVFGYEPVSAQDNDYIAVRTALYDGIQFDDRDVDGQRAREWHLNSKISR